MNLSIRPQQCIQDCFGNKASHHPKSSQGKTRLKSFFCAGLMAMSLTTLTPKEAQAGLSVKADTILFNAHITTMNDKVPEVQAMALREGKIMAIGASSQMKALKGPQTVMVDLKGRRVIPGMIDSHMHGIRAALSFSKEVHWFGTHSLSEALGKLSAAAQKSSPGEWLVVAGGWTPEQFIEKRRPTQAELQSAAPNNPVYVQWMYDWAMLTPLAHEKLGLNALSDLPKGAQFELDSRGQKTGAIQGGIVALFDRLPKPQYADKLEGSMRFFTELNRVGLTGFMDPGGFNMSPDEYAPVMELWRTGKLSVRIDFSYFSQQKGRELEEFQGLTALLPQGFGGERLRFNGIGERVTFNMYNNDHPTPEDQEAFYQVARWAALRGMTLTQHWQNGQTVHYLLDVLERLNQETPLAPLRWSIAHLNDAKQETFSRMQKLGVAWAMQDAMYYDGERLLKERGPEALSQMPMLVSAMNTGVHIGAGTDAHRVANYNPFVALQWMLDGKSAGGVSLRSKAEIPTRQQALALYTQGSAWLAHAEKERGELSVGKAADLVVLSDDYFKVETAKIGTIHSVLTLVGNEVVYAEEDFSGLWKH